MAEPNPIVVAAFHELRRRKGSPTQQTIAENSGISAPQVSVALRGMGSARARSTVWSALGGMKADLDKAVAGIYPFGENVTEPAQDFINKYEETTVVVDEPSTEVAVNEVMPMPRLPQVLIPQPGDTIVLGFMDKLDKESKSSLKNYLADMGVRLIGLRGPVELEDIDF